MKRIIILIPALFLYCSASISQSCTSGPAINCSGEKVISPAVQAPLGISMVSANCSTLVVKWNGSASQIFGVNATYKNTVTYATDTLAATTINCDVNNNCTAIFPVTAGTKYNFAVEAKDMVSGCPFYSYPVVKMMEYPVAACGQIGNSLSFSGKVLLQGAYNTATGKMNNDLNSLGILQSKAATQPYNNMAFNYTGTEQINAGFFAAHPIIVDWVLIELRDPNVATSIVARRAAFVTQDGSLVETDGSNNNVSFPGVAAGQYNVTIRHRNHLGIRTTTPVDFTTGTGSYDFTTANYQSYKNQSYPSTVQMGNVWVMRGGNANVSSLVKYTGPGNAQNQILNGKLGGSLSQILHNVYAPEDVNMNGNIKWAGPGNDQNFLLNTVLSGSLSAILIEQF